jgi:glycosyltransferase involved in cell wall biosynthesis
VTKPALVIVALLANEDARRPTKRYLADVTPSTLPVVCLLQGDALDARDCEKIARASHAIILSPDASVTAGWTDELSSVVSDYPESVIVPVSPNVHGPQRTILEDHQSVRYLKDQMVYANEMRKAFHGIVQPIAYATELVACAPSAWALDALEIPGKTISKDVFTNLYRSHPLLLAQGSAVFASVVKEQLIPGAEPLSPLVSLCMIVKDEEVMLGDALDSVRGLVDEMIVYDTGSSDATVEIAKAHGATVIEGEWRDDFAWARNQTLNYAHGLWVLWIDADERVRGDINALKVRLEDPFAPFESYSVRIQNVTGAGLTSTQHYANRLFRRKDCYWRGALHETVWYRDNRRTSYAAQSVEFHLEHLGYLYTTMVARNKAERNIRIAEHNDSAASPEEVALHEARSLTMASRYEEAIELVQNKVLTGDSPAMERIATLALGTWLRVVKRYDEALDVIDRYESLGFAPEFAANDRAMIAYDQGDFADAIEYASQVTRVVADRDGLTVQPDGLIAMKARALVKLERPADAARVVIEGISRGVMDMHFGELLGFMEAGDVPVTELVDALLDDKKPLILAQLLQIDPEIADRALTQMHAIDPDDRTILAAGSLVARHLQRERQDYWDAALAEQGLVSTGG